MISKASLVGTIFVAASSATSVIAEPAGTAISYQGQLKLDDRPLSGRADFIFDLYDAEFDGGVISTATLDGIDVVDGLFGVQLDFGPNAFDGNTRWIEIAVRSPAGSGEYTTLMPRQPITPVPYACKSLAGDGNGDGHSLDAADGDPIDVVYADEDGNIGIATTEPGSTLDVEGETRTNMLSIMGDFWAPSLGIFRDDDAESPFGKALVMRVGGSGYGGYPIQVGRDDGTNHVVIPGSVGMGTADPSGKLTIRSSGQPIRLERDGRETWSVYQTSTGADGLGFYNQDDQVYRLFLTEGGNVGVGTTSPLSQLDVRSSGTATPSRVMAANANQDTWLELWSGHSAGSNDPAIIWADGTELRLGHGDQDGNPFTERMRITSNGDVGIGTSTVTGSSTQRHLALANTRGGSLQFHSNYHGNPRESRVYHYDGASPADAEGLILMSDKQINLYTNGAHRMILTNSGNVGIGTTNPGSRLTVAGVVESAAGFRFPDGTVQTTAADGGGGGSKWTSSGSDIFYNAGNVGIGTSAPGSKLAIDAHDNQLLLSNPDASKAAAIVFNTMAGDPDQGGITFQRRDPDGTWTADSQVLMTINVADATVSVPGIIESTAGGIRFPDGTVQTSADTGPGVDGVTSLNMKTGPVVLRSGPGISITDSPVDNPQEIWISQLAGDAITSINGQTGPGITLVEGSNVSISSSDNEITISAEGGGGCTDCIERIKVNSVSDLGASGPDVIIEGTGLASISRVGSRIIINVDDVSSDVCRYNGLAYSPGAKCRLGGSNDTCISPYDMLICQSDGTWRESSGTDCTTAPPICGQ